MADGFIVRKGGVTTEQALAPTITEVSTTETSITFTIKNNDASTAVILYEVDDATPDANSIELAAAATSGSITVSDLASDTAFIVYATANVTGKVKSNVTELEISTDVPIVYTAATGGTTAEYDSGGKRFKSHTFTSNGNFVVSTVGDNVDDRNKVDYLIIAGGGGAVLGGGGAGGFRTTIAPVPGNQTPDEKITVTSSTFAVFIGAGGNGVPNGVGNQGVDGANSSAFTRISTGGGGSGGGAGAGAHNSGRNGGSGGGSHFTGTGGIGISSQGRNGGNGNSFGDSAAGGGGAAEVGQSASQFTGGNGGNGLANLLRTGLNETRAGGGGGYGNSQGTFGTGGTGGGGNGVISGAGQNGTVNTGSGGGGGLTNSSSNGSGGSGIVVIRYEIATV